MKKIGGWWLADHKALPDEKILYSCMANRTQSPNRAVGGKFFLTNKRMLFCPHWIDFALWGRKWSADLKQIKAIGIEPKGGPDIYGGAIRDRLKITLQDDKVELFVVNNLNKTLEQLKTLFINQ